MALLGELEIGRSKRRLYGESLANLLRSIFLGTTQLAAAIRNV